MTPRILLAAVPLMLLPACGGPEVRTDVPQRSQRTAAAEPVESGPEADASARLACRHYRNVMRDVAAGVMTDAELRAKLREVHETARVSTVPGVPGAAQEMLAEMTTGTSDGLIAAAGRFSDACRSVGL